MDYCSNGKKPFSVQTTYTVVSGSLQIHVLCLLVADAPFFCLQTCKMEFHEIPNVYFQQPKDTMRLDETMLVKQLLPEICHFIHTYREGNQHAAELRNSASGVLFSLSCNNFNAVFSRISTRQVFFSSLTQCIRRSTKYWSVEHLS